MLLKPTGITAMRAFVFVALLVPLSAVAADPKPLFNGKDLTGWEGDEKTWRVEDGAMKDEVVR